MTKGTQIKHPIIHQAYLLVSDGEIKLNEHILKKGDATEITELSEINLKALAPAEIVVINAPVQGMSS